MKGKSSETSDLEKTNYVLLILPHTPAQERMIRFGSICWGTLPMVAVIENSGS